MKRVFFKLGAVLIGLAVAVLLSEVGLRLYPPTNLARGGRERDVFCRFDPQLGWAPLGNITGVHAKIGHPTLVHQNQYGLRGPDDMQLTRTTGKRRVLVLGDSYAWGFGVNQNEMFSAPEVHGSTNEEILNFGVSGYGTDQELLLYRSRGTKFIVDEVVVALTPYNDIENNLAPKQYGYLKPYFTLGDKLMLHNEHVRETKLQSLGRFLLHHSRVWAGLGDFSRAVSEHFGGREESSGVASARKEQLSPKDVSDRDREGVALTVEILKQFRDAVAAQKAEFTVVFIPYKPNIDERLPDNHPLVPLIAAGLTRSGIKYREPYPAFLKAAKAGAHLFNDPDNHFGPEGHALFAKFLIQTETAKSSVNYYARQ